MRITDLDMQRRWTNMEKDAVTLPHSDFSEVYTCIYRCTCMYIYTHEERGIFVLAYTVFVVYIH